MHELSLEGWENESAENSRHRRIEAESTRVCGKLQAAELGWRTKWGVGRDEVGKISKSLGDYGGRTFGLCPARKTMARGRGGGVRRTFQRLWGLSQTHPSKHLVVYMITEVLSPASSIRLSAYQHGLDRR